MEMCFLEKQLLSFLILLRELGIDLDSEHMMVKEGYPWREERSGTKRK